MKLSIVIVWPCQTTRSRTSSQTPVEMRPLVFVFAFAAHGATGELGARASLSSDDHLRGATLARLRL